MTQAKPTAVSALDLQAFFRCLATLFVSSVPINLALNLLGEQFGDRPMGAVSQHLARTVESGGALSQAMTCFPTVFSELQCGLVRVGETSGRLDKVLERLAGDVERHHRRILQLRQALIYPAFLFAACLAMLVLGPPYLLEPHFRLIRESGAQPPPLTMAVMGVSDLLRGPLFYGGIALLVAGGALLRRKLRGRELRKAVGRRILGLPVVGRLVRAVAITRFLETAALLLEAGVPMHSALRLAARSTGNPAVEDRLQLAAQAMEEGRTLSQALASTGVLPPEVLAVVRAGEESGELSQSLVWTAGMCELQLESLLDVVAASVEPAVMMIMGLMAGILMLATLVPLTQVLQNL
ncbi:MAG: type II secretion system F family protein [Armatimonadetes bacterium]|nr:type II secretion system F family protein [Armatimonadota bacterium]